MNNDFVIKEMLKEFNPNKRREIVNEDLLSLTIEDLKQDEGLPYLTKRANIIIKEYLGFNEDGKNKSIEEISEKMQISSINTKAAIKSNVARAFYRIRYINMLHQSDPSVDIVELYKALRILSNRTVDQLFRYMIHKLSDFMSLDEDSVKKIKNVGDLGLSEIEAAQNIINAAPRTEVAPKVEETIEEEPTIKENNTNKMKDLLDLKKLVLLLRKKQELQDQVNELDNEINALLSSLNIDEDFGHGTK